MRTHRWFAALAMTAGLLGSAQSAPVLDANFQGGLNGQAFNSELYRAQVFTVENTGKLVRFEVARQGQGSSQFQIWNVTAGMPAVIPGSSLASAMVGFNGDGFFGADITSFDLDVTAGDMLALVQIGDASASGSWRFATNTAYAGGAAFTTRINDPSGAWQSFSFANSDFGFKTFVDTGSQPLPEPLTASLVLAGLASAALARRRAPKA